MNSRVFVLSAMVVLIGCGPDAATEKRSEEHLAAGMSGNAHVTLPKGVKPGTNRAATYTYWHAAVNDLSTCLDPSISGANNYKVIVQTVLALPADNVDSEAVLAITGYANTLRYVTSGGMQWATAIGSIGGDTGNAAKNGLGEADQEKAAITKGVVQISDTGKRLEDRYKLSFPGLSVKPCAAAKS